MKTDEKNLFIEMNIEGAEFEILEALLTRVAEFPNLKCLLIQFHPFVENHENRLIQIHQGLRQYFTLAKDYRWVWELWIRKIE